MKLNYNANISFRVKMYVILSCIFILFVLLSLSGHLDHSETLKDIFTSCYTAILVYGLIEFVNFLQIKHSKDTNLKMLIALTNELRQGHCSKCAESSIECFIPAKWGISNITETRRTFTGSQHYFLKNAKYQVDVIAFGLSESIGANTFSEVANELLQRDYKIRIICPKENSNTAENQSLFEMDNSSRTTENECRNSEKNENSLTPKIKKLKEWVAKVKEELSKKNECTEKIKLVEYDELPLFFYMRIDDVIYTGPYILGKLSKESITFQFNKGGEGFKYFENYFEETWKFLDEN